MDMRKCMEDMAKVIVMQRMKDCSSLLLQPNVLLATHSLRVWKLNDPTVRRSLDEVMTREMSRSEVDESSVKSLWSTYKNSLLRATSEICGKSSKVVG